MRIAFPPLGAPLEQGNYVVHLSLATERLTTSRVCAPVKLYLAKDLAKSFKFFDGNVSKQAATHLLTPKRPRGKTFQVARHV